MLMNKWLFLVFGILLGVGATNAAWGHLPGAVAAFGFALFGRFFCDLLGDVNS